MSGNVNPVLANAQQRAVVVGNAQKMVQPIFNTKVNPNDNPTLNIPPRNVGLILGFIIEVTGGATNAAGAAANRTGLGSANMVRNFTFTDLNNTQRINTTGSHIALLNSARQGFGFGGAYAPNLPMGYGNNWAPFSAPTQIAGGAAATLTHTYFLPLAYSSQDLRGAIYAGVVNATMNLQITLANSAQLGVADGADPLRAIYQGNDGIGWTDGVNVTVYQVYLDQLPAYNGVPVLPMHDLNTIYDLKSTVVTGLSQGQDFPVPYANFREFLSTFAIYDNGGQFNSGSDVNTFSMVAANSTQLFRMSPNIVALQSRQTFMADTPPGVYYFDHREKPISTITYGNLELTLNPKVVNAGAQVEMLYESFALASQLPVASSLAGGTN